MCATAPSLSPLTPLLQMLLKEPKQKCPSFLLRREMQTFVPLGTAKETRELIQWAWWLGLLTGCNHVPEMKITGAEEEQKLYSVRFPVGESWGEKKFKWQSPQPSLNLWGTLWRVLKSVREQWTSKWEPYKFPLLCLNRTKWKQLWTLVCLHQFPRRIYHALAGLNF